MISPSYQYVDSSDPEASNFTHEIEMTAAIDGGKLDSNVMRVCSTSSESSPPSSPLSPSSPSSPCLDTIARPSAVSVPGGTHQRIWTMALFFSTTVLLFADQNIMAPNLTSMARYFGFNDEERDRKLAGDIALAFWVLGAPAGILVGRLADTCNRSKLFALTVWIGEGACMASYFVTTYRQLYWCRALTGVSVGGAFPLIFSILGDLLPAENRHFGSAVVNMGIGFGVSLGQGIAGFLGPSFGWRLPFLVISIPALLSATVVFFCVKDPPRGGMEQAAKQFRHQLDDERLTSSEEVMCDQTDHSDLKGHWFAFWTLMRTPSLLLLIIQGAPGCLPWGVINSFLNDFLAEDRGMSVENATLTLLLFGLGVSGGLVIGGAGGSYLYRLDNRYPAILSGSMAIAGCFPLWLMINAIDSESSGLSIGTISIVSGIAAGITGPIVKGSVQNVTLPESRGLAIALCNTFDDFGRGLGPVFVAMLISRLGRTKAFNVATSFWILCGILNGLTFFTVVEDERHVQATVAAKLARRPPSRTVV